MVIGIIGTRRRDAPEDDAAIEDAFRKIYRTGDEIVSGGCPQGGDRVAEDLARRCQVPIKIYYAEWYRFKKKAGFVRNTYIARDADMLIACVADDRTGGTEDTIAKFKKMHKGVGRVIIV